MFQEKAKKRFIKENWKRLAIWAIVALLCGYCCHVTNTLSRYGLPGHTTQSFYHVCKYNQHVCKMGSLTLEPGQTLQQSFKAGGNIAGFCTELYLELDQEADFVPLDLAVALWSETDGEILASEELKLEELPKDGILTFPFQEGVTLINGRAYAVHVYNQSEAETVTFRVNESVQSGALMLDGETVDTLLNFGFLRTSLYAPSALVKILMVITCVTVLTGLALALFTSIREEFLYLVLAAGFGMVALFALTPLYGFDMKFQFDSAYVLSNELLGIEETVKAPSSLNPKANVVHYYRRKCDDHALYQFYYMDSVSDNYSDVAASLKDIRVEPEEQELILVESSQGILSDQLHILYLPQAIGFAAARLLGLNFYLMLQAGRMAAYGCFVLLMFFAIRAFPFGKRLMMVLALMPAVMTQTVSITRDMMIIGLSFFVVSKVLQAAYSEKRPSMVQWLVILMASALLAPCKAIYLPISFFWLLIFYRQDIYGKKPQWGSLLLRVICCTIPIMVVMAGNSSVSIIKMLVNIFRQPVPQSGAAAAVQAVTETVTVSTPANYTVTYALTHLPDTLLVCVNTLRQQLGDYLINGIQLFEIDLGSSGSMTIWLLLLLLLESCRVEETREMIRPVERYFALLIGVCVIMLAMLASLQWTSVGSYTINGLQGRYLIPMFPLLCIFLMNNKMVRIHGASELFVKASCCLFPAVYLMNMYLWTITR